MLSFEMKVQRRVTAVGFGAHFTHFFCFRRSIILEFSIRIITSYLRGDNILNPFDRWIDVGLISIVVLFDFYRVLEILIRLLHDPLWTSDRIRWRDAFVLRSNMEVKRWRARVILPTATKWLWFLVRHMVRLCHLFNLRLCGIEIDSGALGRLFKL